MEELNINNLYQQHYKDSLKKVSADQSKDQNSSGNGGSNQESGTDTRKEDLSEEDLKQQNIARSNHVRDSFRSILGTTLKSIYVTTDDKSIKIKRRMHYYIRVDKKKIEYKERTPQGMKKYLYYFDDYQLDYLGKFQDESFKRDFFDILEDVSKDIEASKAMVFEERGKPG